MLRLARAVVIGSLLLSLAVCSQSARLLPLAPPFDKDLVVVDWQVKGTEN